MIIPSKTALASMLAFVLAAVLAGLVSVAMAGAIERYNTRALTDALAEGGQDWVGVETDGLRVHLSGTAPDESARIRALQIAGSVVDASRIEDSIAVSARVVVVAPVFRVEAMRNRDDISVIGLVPLAEGDGSALVERLTAIAPDIAVADMLQTADHVAPANWAAAVDFAVEALSQIPVVQISVTAERIEVHALAESAEARQQIEARLLEMAPQGPELVLDLVAPRPVIAPFTLRFEIGGEGARFDACSADTDEARARILGAGRAAGATGQPPCPVGMGSPSPRWAQAAELAIRALAELGSGSVTFTDGAISLVVPADVRQSVFDRIVGRLETTLPEAFTLTAVRLEPEDAGAEAPDSRPEVVATLSEEGQVLIEGRLPDERIRDSVSAFARARFGSEAVTVETRLDAGLPAGWSLRVLTGIEALAELHHGRVLVRAERVEVTGVTGDPETSTRLSSILSEGLGQGADFAVRVRYDEGLDPVAQAPTPDRCEARIHEILAEDKITFAPGSANLDDQSRRALDRIAEVLQECGALELEVAGHTDSQGRAETNLALSQARAEAVINALLSRRVLVSGMVARGYGASQPIADNATAEGREANRRIEFTLVRPEPEPEPIDPALEAALVFEIQTPGANTTRPAPRPARTAAPAD